MRFLFTVVVLPCRVFAGEAKAVLEHLPTMDDGSYFEAQSAGNVVMQLDEMDAEGTPAAAAAAGAGSHAA